MCCRNRQVCFHSWFPGIKIWQGVRGLGEEGPNLPQWRGLFVSIKLRLDFYGGGARVDRVPVGDDVTEHDRDTSPVRLGCYKAVIRVQLYTPLVDDAGFKHEITKKSVH
jgi:hypothetical protein